MTPSPPFPLDLTNVKMIKKGLLKKKKEGKVLSVV